MNSSKPDIRNQNKIILSLSTKDQYRQNLLTSTNICDYSRIRTGSIMSQSKFTIDQIIYRLNQETDRNGEISLTLIEVICANKKLTLTGIERLIKNHIGNLSSEQKPNLLKKLIRNRRLTIDARMIALRYLWFQVEPFDNLQFTKFTLAEEVLVQCKGRLDLEFELENLISGIQSKSRNSINDSQKEELPRRRKVVRLDLEVLKGAGSSQLGLSEVSKPPSVTHKIVNIREISLQELRSLLSFSSRRDLCLTIQKQFLKPWGIGIDELKKLITHLGFPLEEKIRIKDEHVCKVIKEQFECEFADQRFWRKDILTDEMLNRSFSDWRTQFGTSRLLSNRSSVPASHIANFDVFSRFVRFLEPRHLFIRMKFGLTCKVNGKSYESLVSYLRLPKKKKSKVARYVLCLRFEGLINEREANFFGLESIESFVSRYSSYRFSGSEQIFIKECVTEEEMCELVAFLFEEFLVHVHHKNSRNFKLDERFYPPNIIRQKKQFLEDLETRKILIRRAHERKSLIHCINCNQPLTDKLSKLRGFGPECWRKVKHLNLKQGELETHLDPIQRGTTREFGDWLEDIQSFFTGLSVHDHGRRSNVGRKI